MYFRLRRSRVAITIATGMTVVGVGTAAALATGSEPASGSFHVLGVGSGHGSGTVLLTGAIGDHGQSMAKGKDVKLTLSKGTLTLNATKLNQAITKAFKHATVNKANCSVSATGTATIPFVNGTGQYAGASGSARITVSIGLIKPRKAGKCEMHVKPVAFQQLVSGTGSVTF